MRIEIIHGRDPDGYCNHTVFVNGERVTGVHIDDIDPGAGGWTASEWRERIEEAKADDGLTPAYREAYVAELTEWASSSWIADDTDDTDAEPDVPVARKADGTYYAECLTCGWVGPDRAELGDPPDTPGTGAPAGTAWHDSTSHTCDDADELDESAWGRDHDPEGGTS